jgi:hypothetical protein
MDKTTYKYCLLEPFEEDIVKLMSKLPMLEGNLRIAKEQLAEHYTVRTVYNNPSLGGTSLRKMTTQLKIHSDYVIMKKIYIDINIYS